MATSPIEPINTSANAMQYVVQQYYDKFYLERLLPELRWYQGCEKKKLPRNSGKSVKFSAYRSVAIPTSTLTEGSKPTAIVMSTYNVTASLVQWGQYTAVSDYVEMTAISSVVEEAIGVMSESSAQTLDLYIRQIAFGSSMVLKPVGKSLSAAVRTRYTGSISALSALNNKVLGFTLKLTGALSAKATTDALSASANWTASAWASGVTLLDIRRAVTTLKSRNVKPFDGKNYLAILSPGAMESVLSDKSTTGFADWTKYTTSEPMFKGEVGIAERCRFIETTDAFDYPTGNVALSATIVSIIGKGGLGVVDFQSVQDVQHGRNESSIIVKRANDYDTSDPLKQVSKLPSLRAILKEKSGYLRETLRKIQILIKSKNAEYMETIRREVINLTPQRLHAGQLVFAS